MTLEREVLILRQSQPVSDLQLRRGKEEESYNFHLNWKPFSLETQKPLCWPPAVCSLLCILFGGWHDYSLNILLQLFRQILSSRNVTNELPCGVGMGPQPAGANYLKNFQANPINISQVTGQESSKSRAAFFYCSRCADLNVSSLPITRGLDTWFQRFS